jgi:thioredoxin reductase (NADPH)
MTETDAVIVGAGPAGLFQAFQLGLLEINAHIVDALPYPGGQCIELYPDKPIYDIPGLPVCTGRELVDRLLQQVRPFSPTFHLGQQVSLLQRQEDGRFLIETNTGTRFLAKTVFIAAGVGAFVARALKLEGIERFEGSQLFYRAGDAQAFAGRDVIVLGGEDEAVEAAVGLAQLSDNRPRSVTLLHRRDVFQAEAQRVDDMRALVAAGALRLVIGQPTGFEVAGDRLAALQVATPEGSTVSLPADALRVCYGLSPKLGPVADWNLALERKQLVVDTEQFQTSEPGIFAIGDINTYPGKKKLILCAFHECVLAAFGAATVVFPGKAVPLQYTTTSTRLHALLGVR